MKKLLRDETHRTDEENAFRVIEARIQDPNHLQAIMDGLFARRGSVRHAYALGLLDAYTEVLEYTEALDNT